MPPRRSTPRKSRAESTESAVSSPAKSTASPASATGTPRRTTRGRRTTAKAAEAPAAKAEPPATPSRTRSARTSKVSAPTERVHALPTRTNPRLSEVKSRQVKLQVIRREDKEIIIGRIKLPTVNGAEHGFLLKRFDTNAIAGSSMFRLAFPYADAEEESAEMAYLESRFDTDVANGGTLAPATPRRGRKADSDNASGGTLPPGSTGVRLQGMWIPCEQAAPIAEDYGLLELAQPLLEATAVLLPNDDVPLLNPDEETLAQASESAQVPLTTPMRQAKRARTAAAANRAEVDEAMTSTPQQAAQQLLGPDSPSSPSKRRSTPRRTRASAAAEADAQTPLTPAQIDAQIRAAKDLAADIAADASATPSTNRPKRRAEEEVDGSVNVAPQTNTAVRTIRRHQRPIVRTAGALTAAGALGVGAAAWYAGTLNLATALPAAFHHLQGTDYTSAIQHLQNLDYSGALHAIQQNIQNWGTSWFA